MFAHRRRMAQPRFYTELRSIMSLESVAKNLRDADAPGVATATLTLHGIPLSMTDYLFDCNLVLAIIGIIIAQLKLKS